MNYIVIDMEWNQPFGKLAFYKRRGIVLNGEIIQIGAVKMSEGQEILSTFKINIKPQKYIVINSRVKKITKITQGQMNSGTDIYTAIDRFQKWCGEDFVFISWGNDDIPMLKTNLDFFKIPYNWIPKFYNAQIFFNQQTENRGRQFSLDFASEYFGVKTDMESHNAFNDAYHTALICQKMDLKFGMKEYDEIVNGNIVFGDGFRGVKVCEESSFIVKTVEKGLKSGKISHGNCPECNKRLKFKDQVKLSEYRYVNLCNCKKHGDFVVYLKFSKTKAKNYHVLVNMYLFDVDFAEWKEKRENTPENTEIMH